MALDSKVLVAALAASVLTSGLWFGLGQYGGSRAGQARPHPLAPATSNAALSAELDERLAQIERGQAEFEVRLNRAEERRREALWQLENELAAQAPGDPSALAAPSAPAGDSLALGTPAARDLVLDVLAEERAREERERAEQAAERLRDLQVQRGLRVAERLELGPGERDALLALLEEEFDRASPLFDAVRNAGRDPAARAVALAEWEAVREWRDEQLEVRFAPSVAERIADEMRAPFNPWRGGRAGGARQGRLGRGASQGDP